MFSTLATSAEVNVVSIPVIPVLFLVSGLALELVAVVLYVTSSVSASRTSASVAKVLFAAGGLLVAAALVTVGVHDPSASAVLLSVVLILLAVASPCVIPAREAATRRRSQVAEVDAKA